MLWKTEMRKIVEIQFSNMHTFLLKFYTLLLAANELVIITNIQLIFM